MSFLDDDVFHTIVANTPLIAIDLVAEDEHGCILLGERKNRPAQGFWFVPGGRIRKNERLDDAFRRLVNEELGYQAERSDARLLDLYEHLYSDSVFGDTPDTHYVVVAHHLRVRRADLCLPQEQHSDFRWWSKPEIADADNVHLNSRVYLDKIKG
tara:strand:- start:1798 stop:2262 length:465 start_codon:yes stop_codon:yes gene_type:complete